MYARTYTIAGRVQGVGFRYFTANHARSFGVTGYVKNRADGTVEVYIEGNEEQILAMHAELEHGPTFARVLEIEFEESVIPSRNYKSFSAD
ncbi:MAG: acylphosphatase [Spirochaetota bacterium]|nr:acylphosphatase [Spirochaetota bacterium]